MNRTAYDYNIFLIGFMGVGKSTVAAALEEMLPMKCAEMDRMIALRKGMEIPEIFEAYGEDFFRDLESRELIELQKEKGRIVSCGGGVILRKENAGYMNMSGRVVWLTASPRTVYERVKDSSERPLLNNNMSVEYISALMEKRRSLYEEAADIIVATDGKSASEIAREIILGLNALENGDWAGENAGNEQ